MTLLPMTLCDVIVRLDGGRFVDVTSFADCDDIISCRCRHIDVIIADVSLLLVSQFTSLLLLLFGA